MKTFIGLGSDHEKDVFLKTYNTLAANNPQAITLEERATREVVDEPFPNKRWRARKKELLSKNGLDYIIKKNQSYDTRIRVEDFDVVRTIEPEIGGAIKFAQEHDLPFYLVEWEHDFPDIIFKLHKGRISPISLKGKTTYQDYPDEYYKGFDIPYIRNDDVEARNRFVSDGINFFLTQYDIIAHISGWGHFDSGVGPVIGLFSYYSLRKGMEIQNLVKADKKVIINLAKAPPSKLQKIF